MNGKIGDVNGTDLDNQHVRFTLNLDPYETKFIVVGKEPADLSE